MSNFKIGDVVYLKKNIQPMVVKEIESLADDPSQYLVLCNWFVSKEIHEHEFNSEMLTLQKPD